MSWLNIGGGCDVTRDRQYPCDDEYEHTETGERVKVYSTQEQHFEMPEEVGNIFDFFALPGVKPEWMEDAEAWKR